MRIAYFTESLLPLVDGVSVTLGHLFDDLEARGVDFRVYSPFVPPPEIPWAHRVRRVPSFSFPLYTDYRLSLPWGQGLARELDRWKPDVVHLVSPTPAGNWARRYARRRRVPLVATFHTHFVSYFSYYGLGLLERFGWWLMRRFYAPFDLIFAPSAAIARLLEDKGIGPVRIWSRGIDTDRFSPRWRDPDLPTAATATTAAALPRLKQRYRDEIVDDHVRENMEEVLEQVQNGEFAREWINENQANRPAYKQYRGAEQAHEIEDVGERLRALFAWSDDAGSADAEAVARAGAGL